MFFGWHGLWVTGFWWQTFANCLDNWVLGVSLSKSDFFLTYLLILKILYFDKNSNGDNLRGRYFSNPWLIFKMITH